MQASYILTHTSRLGTCQPFAKMDLEASNQEFLQLVFSSSVPPGFGLLVPWCRTESRTSLHARGVNPGG